MLLLLAVTPSKGHQFVNMNGSMVTFNKACACLTTSRLLAKKVQGEGHAGPNIHALKGQRRRDQTGGKVAHKLMQTPQRHCFFFFLSSKLDMKQKKEQLLSCLFICQRFPSPSFCRESFFVCFLKYDEASLFMNEVESEQQ